MSGAGWLARAWLASLPRPFRARRHLERYQVAALRRLIDHAWERVPFYRRRLEASGLRPQDVRGPADLARLEPVSRRELQQTALDDRLARGVEVERCVLHETSGSSGEPLRIVRTPAEDARLFGVRLRAQVLSGLRPWDLRVNIGSPRLLFRWHRIGAFRIRTVSNRQGRADVLEQLLALDPDVLMTAPETLELLLESAAGERRPRPRLVFTGANQLRPSLRRRAERKLGARVTDFYGTTECNLIAWECHRCGHYHTCDDSVIVEVVREDGAAAAPGEEGEVLLTALHSFAMPFIRFRIGDLAVRPAEPRRCIIRFGAIERIQGRIIDYLRFPGGVLVAPFPLLDALDSLEGLGRWQAVQHAETRVEVRFEPLAAGAEESLRGGIEARCRDLFPAGVEVEVRAVAFPEPTGAADPAKHRFVRSLASNAAETTGSTTLAGRPGTTAGA